MLNHSVELKFQANFVSHNHESKYLTVFGGAFGLNSLLPSPAAWRTSVL